MPEENVEAVSIEAEETAQPESAPVEPNTSEESDLGENQGKPNTAEPKMVPLTALQKERQRRKEAEEYARTIESSYSVEPQTEVQAEEFQAPAPQVERQFMTRAEYEFLEGERTRWQEAESKFPELKDPEIRELAEARRERALLKTGKYLTPAEAAHQTVDLIKKARSEGQKAAQESVSIQQRETIESSGSPSRKSATDDVVSVIKNSNDESQKKAALLEYLKQ